MAAPALVPGRSPGFRRHGWNDRLKRERTGNPRRCKKESRRTLHSTPCQLPGDRHDAHVKTTVTELTDQLVASYARAGGINHLDGVNLPAKSAVACITVDLLRLLFPGFFDERTIHSAEIKMVTANLMDSLQGRLEDEIYKSLQYNCRQESRETDLRGLANDLTCGFLSRLPTIRELLQTDAEAAFNGDPAALSKDEVILAYPCMEAVAVQRMAHELYLKEIALLPRLMTEWAHSRTGMDLHPGAKIGSYFFIDHGTGTVIGETAEIGDHVKLYQGVGLVARSLAGGQKLRGQKRHPTLQDRVTIYSGATIVGGETVVGQGSTIGANVFLMQSVPPHSLVLSEDVKVKVMDKRSRVPGTGDFQI